MESVDDAPAAPLALSAVRRRYPRLHAAFSLLSYRERQYLGDMGDDDSLICNVDAETGLLTKIACTDFAAPLDEPPADCAMKIDSDANRFSVFVAKCLEAAESGDEEEDAEMQHTIMQSALEDALGMATVASRFEHLLGWTAAGAHHGLHPMLGHGDADANASLLTSASDAWRGLFEKVHRHGPRLGVAVELRQFALRTCAMLKFFLRDAKDDCGVRVGYTFHYLQKSAGDPGSVAAVSGSVPPSHGSTTTPSTAASTRSHSHGEDHGPKRVIVTVTKPSRDAKLGLGIGQKKGAVGVRVNSIPAGGLFAGTGLETGMVIESVNGEPYDTFAECLALLKGAEGELTVVAVERAASPVPASVALPAAPFRDEAPPSSDEDEDEESSVPSDDSSAEPDEEEPEEESDEDDEEPDDESEVGTDDESDEGTARMWERGGMVPGTAAVPETIRCESEEESENDYESDHGSEASAAAKRKSADSDSDAEESAKRARRTFPKWNKEAKAAAAEFMDRVNAVEGVPEGLVYDTCPEVVDKIRAFLQREGVTKAALQRAMGGINGNSMGKFLTSEGQEQCGNVTYRRGYVFFEKLRILEGEEKSLERIENEEEFPKGFPLSRKGWYSSD